MKREQITIHSARLCRDMPLIAYGDAGYPVIAFPTQDSPCTNFEEFGMIDALADFIDAGVIRLFCVGSVDAESWSDAQGDNEHRTQVQEAFFNHICEELVPFVRDRCADARRPLAMGCSMGATHAVICALRRPDLFQGCIALSGVYDARYFFGDWMDATLYLNSPVDFLPGMDADHPQLDVLRQRQLVLCVGQGAWEEEGIRTQRLLDSEFKRLNLPVWCDYWGYDVNHDWDWWFKQARYFLPIVLDEIG